MKSKKKNEMEKAKKTMGAAQELDMNALEDVAGGRIEKGRIIAGGQMYNVYDDKTRELKASTWGESAANRYDLYYNK